MTEIDRILDANRAAVDDLIKAAEGSSAGWATPRAPGKWSPAQVVEHIARNLEESANVVAGTPSKYPTLPAFVRPLLRGLFFNRILKNEKFTKGKTPKPFNPEHGPADPAEGRARLDSAFAKFSTQCQSKDGDGQDVVSGVFGPVSLANYAKFQELHTRHHRGQIPD